MADNNKQTSILFASTNLGKITEVRSLLSECGISVSVPSDLLDPVPDVAETGSTFAENALLKATTYSALTGNIVVADDSGLMVHALGGEPGVHSNRWFEGTPAERNSALLDRLSGKSDRTAAFVTVACLYFPDGTHHFFEGILPGTIALTPEGPPESGFGYDPIFIPEGYSSTLSSLGVAIKNTISHRAIAFTALAAFLKKSDAIL